MKKNMILDLEDTALRKKHSAHLGSSNKSRLKVEVQPKVWAKHKLSLVFQSDMK